MSGTITNEDVSGAFETMEDLGRLSAPEAIVGRLAKYLERYGFTSFLVSGLPSQNERLEPYILLNSWPKEWYSRYTRANYYSSDPCVRHCFSTVEPFTWSELPGPLLEGRRAKLIMGDAADCGLVEGMCVPLHDVYGFQAVVTMAGDKIEVPPNARKLVHLTSLYAFGAAERAIRPSPPTQRLTEREREIMSWTAAGKTAWEIGEVLGIAQATVAAHMMHIREKLGTQNAAHSVAEALRRREIRL
jgi:LuxR family transcriptional regulator, quorum-sensing system regulator BjaR1